MNQKFILRVQKNIHAPVAKVWDALTKPELIEQYFFGTHVVTDWKVGGPILYRGEWKGKTYEDKGTILKVEPEKHLVSTFWSALEGLPDLPENYKTITYELAAKGTGTELTLLQDNNRSQAEADHSRRNWSKVLDGLKELVEK